MPVQSFACEGRDLVFEDDFKSDLGGWDPNQGLTFGELGGKVIFPRHWGIFQIMNLAVSPLDGDLCMTASFPQDNNNAAIGIRFWVRDGANYYTWQVTQHGSARLWRQYLGLRLLLWEGDVNRALGTSATIRVIIKNSSVSGYVNGAKVQDFTVKPPTGQVRFGFHLQLDGGTTSVDERVFSTIHYKVTSAD